jgi:hypothetical protein
MRKYIREEIYKSPHGMEVDLLKDFMKPRKIEKVNLRESVDRN